MKQKITKFKLIHGHDKRLTYVDMITECVLLEFISQFGVGDNTEYEVFWYEVLTVFPHALQNYKTYICIYIKIL